MEYSRVAASHSTSRKPASNRFQIVCLNAIITVSLIPIIILISGSICYIYVLFLQVKSVGSFEYLLFASTFLALVAFVFAQVQKSALMRQLKEESSDTDKLQLMMSQIILLLTSITLAVNQNLLRSGDAIGFQRVVNIFNSNQGPFNFGVFRVDQLTADRSLISRSGFGPFYPQAAHFTVSLIQSITNLDFGPICRTVVSFSCVFPMLSLLLLISSRFGLVFQQALQISSITSCLLIYELKTGQFPNAIAVSILCWMFAFQPLHGTKKLLFIVGCSAILVVTHPSCLFSMFLLLPIAKPIRPRLRAMSSKTLIVILLLGLIAIVPRVDEMLSPQTPIVQVNFDYKEFFFRSMSFVLKNFIMFGKDPRAVLPLSVLLIFFILRFIRLHHPSSLVRCIPTALIVASTAFGGMVGLSGLPRILSLPWYASPVRVSHIWVLSVFFVILLNTKERQSTQKLEPLFRTAIVLSCTIYLSRVANF